MSRSYERHTKLYNLNPAPFPDVSLTWACISRTKPFQAGSSWKRNLYSLCASKKLDLASRHCLALAALPGETLRGTLNRNNGFVPAQQSKASPTRLIESDLFVHGFKHLRELSTVNSLHIVLYFAHYSFQHKQFCYDWLAAFF